MNVRPLFDRSLTSREACEAFFRKKGKAKLVMLRGAVHTAVFAMTGGGKGVSIVIPHLLSCKSSTWVLDVKGENYRITAEARRKMGHEVVLLDPFNIVGGGVGFN